MIGHIYIGAGKKTVERRGGAYLRICHPDKAYEIHVVREVSENTHWANSSDCHG